MSPARSRPTWPAQRHVRHHRSVADREDRSHAPAQRSAVPASTYRRASRSQAAAACGGHSDVERCGACARSPDAAPRSCAETGIGVPPSLTPLDPVALKSPINHFAPYVARVTGGADDPAAWPARPCRVHALPQDVAVDLRPSASALASPAGPGGERTGRWPAVSHVLRLQGVSWRCAGQLGLARARPQMRRRWSGSDARGPREHRLQVRSRQCSVGLAATTTAPAPLLRRPAEPTVVLSEPCRRAGSGRWPVATLTASPTAGRARNCRRPPP